MEIKFPHEIVKKLPSAKELKEEKLVEIFDTIPKGLYSYKNNVLTLNYHVNDGDYDLNRPTQRKKLLVDNVIEAFEFEEELKAIEIYMVLFKKRYHFYVTRKEVNQNIENIAEFIKTKFVRIIINQEKD